MEVSIIVAMYNIADTLEECLQSISQQNHKHWEAILIDDGSTDGSVEIANTYAFADKRFRVIRQDHCGVGTARNRGIRAARYDWLLFLDGDDWIRPQHLEQMTSMLMADKNLGAVYCGWCWFSPDGYYFYNDIGRETGDLFPLHAVECPYAIHAYVVKRKIVETVGGFNADLRTCEDWDLWQRVARTGVKFGRVPQVMAPARMRAGSASMGGGRILSDGLMVLRQGYEPDLRLPKQHPLYLNGLPDEGIVEKKFYLLCSAAGLCIGRGEDPVFLLNMLRDDSCPKLEAYSVADCITLAAMLSACQPLKEWKKEWLRMEHLTYQFLDELEEHSGTRGLAHKVRRYLRPLISIHMGAIGGVCRLNAALSWLVLLPIKVKSFVKRQIWFIFRWVKQAVKVGLRMNSRIYRFAFQIFRQLRPIEDGIYFEELFEERADPWGYTSEYEQTKYEQTLDLIPSGRFQDAIELACAEGHFTVQLAPRVEYLLAVDISKIALDRAAERCRRYSHIRYEQLDFLKNPIPGQYDLMICSEVLYFAGSRFSLRKVAKKMTAALKPGGYLIMAHGNVVNDEMNRTGFNWEHAYGAKGIGETFASLPSINFLKELHTPLYRIQLFERKRSEQSFRRTNIPEIIEVEQPTALEPEVSSQVLWNGAAKALPVILYHSVAPSRSKELFEYHVTPKQFEEQLGFLRDSGFKSINIEDCRNWYYESTPIPARSIMITFDDGYRDFLEYAWPLLKQYGFTANIFLVAGEIAQTNRWDHHYGESKPLLTWAEIGRLQEEKVSFGSHSMTHPMLTKRSWKQIKKELYESKLLLEQGLSVPVTAFAYPYGEFNRRIQFLTGYKEYRLAFSCEPGKCTVLNSPLAIPRIEIERGDTLETFAGKIA